MISVVRVALLSRSAHWVALTALVMWVVAAVTGRRSVEIDLSAYGPATKLPIVELCAILGATVLAILTRPQFWEWDRIGSSAIGSRRPRVVAFVAAAAGIVLPALCVPAVVPWLPADTPWAWVLSNALIMSATVQLLAPLLTPLAAGTIAMLSWLTFGLITNLAPGAWVPLSSYQDTDGNWILVTALITAALAVHTRTCGRTAWAYRRFAKEQ